jgi:RNA polymerase sigma-70 factor (ECF subfamily)
VRSRWIPRTDLVDDLVQDIYVAAWENLGSYRGGAPLGSWLYGIARHKVENCYRACLQALLALDEGSQDSAAAVVEPDLDEFLDRDRLQKKDPERPGRSD